MRSSLVAAAMAALFGASVPAAASTVLINGSFEDGVPGNVRGSVNNALFDRMDTVGPNWDAWSSLYGWTLASGAGIAVETDRTRTFIDPQNGEYYVALDRIGNSSITQTVALAVGRYTMSLWYSPMTNNAATNGVTFGVSGLGGATATVGTNGAARGLWTQLFLDLTVAVAGNYQVYLGATGSSNGRGALIDNVSLAPAPVPLPAAGAGLLAALGLLAGLRRKRAA